MIADKKRQNVNRQRENQPAEEAEANGVEEKSEGEHGGGSMLQRGNGCAFHHHHGATLDMAVETRRSCGDATLPRWWWREWRRRSFASEFPDRDAELLRLVGEVVLDAGAREMHDADRQNRRALRRCA